jgi:hypothetical protein
MNVTTAANGQYAAYQYGICNKTGGFKTVANGQYVASQPNTNNKTGGFKEVLQEQSQKPQEPSPVLPQESSTNTPMLYDIPSEMFYDLRSGQTVEMKFWWPDINNDLGLGLYAAQLAVELGITKNDLFAKNFKFQNDTEPIHFYHPDLCSPNFKTQDQAGNAGKVRPIFLFYNAIQELLDAGLISKKDIIDKVKHQPEYIQCEDGAGGCVTKLNYEGYENIEPTLVFSSALDLFEKIWGNSKTAS